MTTIPELFREWYRLMVTVEPEEDAETGRLVDEANAIAAQMMTMPTVTAADLAMKYVVESGNDAWQVESDWLAENIYALAGVPPPADRDGPPAFNLTRADRESEARQ